jgi:hypothetical protein
MMIYLAIAIGLLMPHEYGMGPIEPIAHACVVSAPRQPVLGNRETDIAACVVWAWHESRNRDILGDSGKAHGPWQLWNCRKADIDGQAACWYNQLIDGAKTCPDSPAAPLSGSCLLAKRLANRRVHQAQKLLAKAIEEANPYNEP